MTFNDYLCQKQKTNASLNRYNFNCQLLQKLDSKWVTGEHTRTVLLKHSQLPAPFFFKLCNELPPTAQPMANILRVPMADKIQKVVNDLKLDQIVIPNKSLIPLFSQKEIDGLDEEQINDAYIVLTEEQPLINQKEMIDNLKKNNILPDQICQIPIETGLGDCTWTNLGMLPNGKLVIYDTEPLYGELGVQAVDSKKFPLNTQILNSQDKTRKACALRGLEALRKSSVEQDLNSYADKANYYLDKVAAY